MFQLAAHPPGREALSQAKVRMGICVFMGVCYAYAGFLTHPLYLSFIAYSIAAWMMASRMQRFHPGWIYTCVVLDNFFTIAGLAVTGERGTFLLIFLIHMSFAYGVRFGRSYLALSLVLSTVGVMLLYANDSPWHGNPHFALAYALGIPFIALYVFYLADRIRRSREQIAMNEQEIRRLLAFVAHDVRASLQALLSTTTLTRAGTREDDTRRRLLQLEDTVNGLGRMLSDVIARSDAHGALPAPRLEVVEPGPWLLRTTRVFEDSAAAAGASLCCHLDLALPAEIALDRGSAERILHNVMSNACRHAVNGSIDVELHHQEGDRQSPASLRIVVCNRELLSPQTHAFEDDSSPSEKASGERRPRFHGAQMGLDIVSTLARDVGGSFRFDDQGGGTFTSTVHLPYESPTTIPQNTFHGAIVVVTDSLTFAQQARALGTAPTSTLSVIRPQELVPRFGRILPWLGTLVVDTASAHADDIRQMLGSRSIRLPVVWCGPGHDAPVVSVIVQERELRVAQLPLEAGWRALSSLIAAVGEHRSDMSSDAGEFGEGMLADKRLLIVDDNHGNALLLESVLARSGARFTHASTVADTLALLGEHTFDGVLLDWNLGTDSAAEIVRTLTERPEQERSVVVIVSAEARETIEAGLAGAPDVTILTKPLAPARLREMIIAALCREEMRPSAAPARPPDPILDRSVYLEIEHSSGGATTLVARLLAEFDQECSALVKEVENLLASADVGLLRRRAHALKSLCDAAGARALGTVGNDIEHLARGGALGRATISRLQAQLLRVWHFTDAHVEVERHALQCRISGQSG